LCGCFILYLLSYFQNVQFYLSLTQISDKRGRFEIGSLKGLEIMTQRDQIYNKKWYDEGYEKGCLFALHEADYDDLAAIYRAGRIPNSWDIYRAEILNEHLGDKGFDFKAYAAGFVCACIEFFKKI